MVSNMTYRIGILIAFFWGVGQFLPYEGWYWYGMSIGDGLFLVYLLLATPRILAVRPWRLDPLLVRYAVAVITFVSLSAVSVTINSFYRDIYAKDIIEAFRPLYYLCLVIFVAAHVRRFGHVPILRAFLIGIATLGLSDLYFVTSQEWTQVFGFVLLSNPNSVGNLFGVGTILISFLVLEKKLIVSAILLVGFLVLSLLTYSKGTWVMSSLGLAACTVAFPQSSHERAGSSAIVKFVYASVLFILLPFLAAHYYPNIERLVAFKLQTTQFGDTADAGSTIAARWGFVLASVRMAFENPFLGVGLSNYETEYDLLREDLGPLYWPTDNPHSAFLYVLACIGVPAFFVFSILFAYPLFMLKDVLPLKGIRKTIYCGLVALAFLTSGSVVLHLLTQHYFWFVSGLLFGWKQHLELNPKNRYANVVAKNRAHESRKNGGIGSGPSTDYSVAGL